MREFRAKLIEYIREQAQPPDKFSHQARLYALAVSLADGTPFDDDVLFASAWLHDLGVFIGHRPADVRALEKWDHVAYAIQTAPPILSSAGFPEAKIAHVLNVIREHLPTSTPSSFEAALLRDADILEQLGAVGILRTASKTGRDTRFRTFADALTVLEANSRNLPAQIQLDSTKRRLPERLRLLQAFLRSAQIESDNVPW